MNSSPLIFFDRSESDFDKVFSIYPKAFHAWDLREVQADVWRFLTAGEPKIILCIGHIHWETNALVTWLKEDIQKEFFTRYIDIIVHMRRSPEGETTTQALLEAGYSVERKRMGIDWMKGIKGCPGC